MPQWMPCENIFMNALIISKFKSNNTINAAIKKRRFFKVNYRQIIAVACTLFITHFLFFSPLCPNLGHQAHQNNNQSLVETRFNGTPQLSPCKFHEKKNVYFRTKNWKPRATNQNKHWKSFLFKQIPSQRCQTKNMEIWGVFVVCTTREIYLVFFCSEY